MNKQVKDKWIAALRSGKYKQTRGFLGDMNGHCCLGVLCEVFADEGNPLSVCMTQQNVVSYNGCTRYPPPDVLEWAGLQNNEGRASNADHCVAFVNDDSYSFAPSIDYILQHWENM